MTPLLYIPETDVASTVRKVKHRDAARTTCTLSHWDARPHNLLKNPSRRPSVKGPLALAAHFLLLLGREVVLHQHTTSVSLPLPPSMLSLSHKALGYTT